MADLVVRPTKKWVRLEYSICWIAIALAVFVYNNQFPDAPKWGMFVPLLVLLWPASHHLRQHFTVVTVQGDKLRYEAGIFSKQIRTVQVSKVQDVCVDQTFAQRLAGIGDVSIETAGETSKLVLKNIDHPTTVQEAILDASQERPSAPPEKKRRG